MAEEKYPPLNLVDDAIKSTILEIEDFNGIATFGQFLNLKDVTFKKDDQGSITDICFTTGGEFTVAPMEEGNVKGNIPEGLAHIQETCADSLKKLIAETIKGGKFEIGDINDEDFYKTPRQVIVTSYYVHFTTKVEEFLEAGDLAGMGEFFKSQKALVAKKLAGELSDNQRKHWDVLAVLVSHYRQVAVKMASIPMDEVRPYWDDHIKFYMDDEDTVQIATDHSADGVTIAYGYRPLALNSLLAITEKTIEFYKEAIAMKYGAMGAWGPSGTGKTETILDFFNIIGRHCTVIDIEQLFKKPWHLVLNDLHGVVFDQFSAPAGIDAEKEQVQAYLYSDLDQKRIFVTDNQFEEFDKNMWNFKSQVQFTVPPVTTILDILLTREGFEDGEELSQSLDEIFKFAMEKLKMTSAMGLGLRQGALICKEAGKMRRDPIHEQMTGGECIAMGLWKVLTSCKL